MRPIFGIAFCGAAIVIATAAAASPPVPQLSGNWGRTNFNLEQLATGPRLIVNTVRKPDGTIDDNAARVGDFNSPLLTPKAAAILRANGEFSRTGQSIPDPHNQCRPEPPPFTMTIQIQVLLLQSKDEVTLVYVNDQQVRHIRLNSAHPHPLVPTWLGDSIGHYEGDTLVVDTIGIKPQGKLAVIDRYGTPFSGQLHVVERYRLIDGKQAEAAVAKHRREFTTNPKMPHFAIYGEEFVSNTPKRGLQVDVTIEDPVMFTQPWAGLLTYVPLMGWPEMVCDEALQEFGTSVRDQPVADKPDF
jgi:hypothetical protein